MLDDKEKINLELNESFSYKIMGERMPIKLKEDSEFNLVIIVQQSRKYNPKGDKKYLFYKLDEPNAALTSTANESLIITEKYENETIPVTPSQNPFSKKNEGLSFREVLGREKSMTDIPDPSPLASTTNRSKFDLQFFRSGNYSIEFKSHLINLGSQNSAKFSDTSSELSSPQAKNSSRKTHIMNQSDRKRTKSTFKNENKWLYSHNTDSNDKIIKLEDNGSSVFMSTPLIIKWNINKLFSTSSIFRVVWNFKDIEVIKVICRTSIHILTDLNILVSNYYTLKDVIEIEIELENNSCNSLELELLPPTEVLQNNTINKVKTYNFFILSY